MYKPKYYVRCSDWGGSSYEGWTNSATWCTNLYLRQDEKLVQRVLSCVTLGQIAAFDLRAVIELSNIYIDGWCEGHVNIPEILAEFQKDFYELLWTPEYRQRMFLARKKG